MGDDQQLRFQQPDVIPHNPLEAPPDFPVLETDDQRRQRQSPCANYGVAAAINCTVNGSTTGNSLKRLSSPSSANPQQPKKLFLDEPIITDFPLPPPAQSPPDCLPGISSNTSPPPPKITPTVPDSVPALHPSRPTPPRCISDPSPPPEWEESLSVERDGKCLNIRFKCHCGKGYHFLVSEGGCFYKLM